MALLPSTISVEDFRTSDDWVDYNHALRRMLAKNPFLLAYRLPWIFRWVPRRRKVALVIGGSSDPYLVRWHLIPRNRWLNLYLHLFLRSDDDRAMHDHPWRNASLLLSGTYLEHTPTGIFHRHPGALYFRKAEALHRVELINHDPVWTLFVTWRKVRDWGFMCPGRRWVHWKDFTAPGQKGIVGKGCGD